MRARCKSSVGLAHQLVRKRQRRVGDEPLGELQIGLFLVLNAVLVSLRLLDLF